ncbi:hypothetical protein D1872_235570 [compost metagenome]
MLIRIAKLEEKKRLDENTQWWRLAVRIAEEEPSALERLPEYPERPQTPLPEIPEILRRFPVLEKLPYVIAPFNE